MGRRKNKNRMPPEVAAVVVERAGGTCEIMHPDAGCNFQAEQVHHRQMRSQGGQHTVENMVHICHLCHGWVHRNPAYSYDQGWLVKGSSNPSIEPFTRQGLTVFLHSDGSFRSAHMPPHEFFEGEK